MYSKTKVLIEKYPVAAQILSTKQILWAFSFLFVIWPEKQPGSHFAVFSISCYRKRQPFFEPIFIVFHWASWVGNMFLRAKLLSSYQDRSFYGTGIFMPKLLHSKYTHCITIRNPELELWVVLDNKGLFRIWLFHTHKTLFKSSCDTFHPEFVFFLNVNQTLESNK